MATSAVLETERTAYDGPWEELKESDAQKQAQDQQNAFNAQLQKIYATQFAEQEQIKAVLTPQLEAMANNPQGFGATEYAALQAKIVNDTGTQYSNVAKEQATQFGVSNEAGLPSGVEAQIQAGLQGAAAGQVAAQSSGLAIANEQLKQQQQQFADTSLLNLNQMSGSQVTATGGQVGSGLQSAFNNATTVYNQGSLWKNILGGVVGAGMNFLTGGISGALQGGSFMSGAGQQMGGQPVTG